MPIPLLDLKPQYESLREEIDEALLGVVREQRFILGPVVERFEAEAAEYVGVEHAVGCASGTDALLLSLRALRLEPGDEVIVPSFTFFATAGAVWNAGLRPVFADVDPATFNLTAETVRAALSERTRAIVVVHLFGQMAAMGPLLELADAHGLVVVEDAAQAFGARQELGGDLPRAGSVGTVGCHSFFPSKNLGGFGDGGMVTTDDDAIAERVRRLRVHGGRKMYEHEMVGTNSRLDALHAAVLSVKLPHVDGWLHERRGHAAFYQARLSRLEARVRTPVTLPRNEHSYNLYTVRVERRDELRAALKGEGIGSAVYYPVPLHLQRCFAELGYRRGDLPESERAAEEVLSLPVYPELTDEQRARVAEAVERFYG